MSEVRTLFNELKKMSAVLCEHNLANSDDAYENAQDETHEAVNTTNFTSNEHYYLVLDLETTKYRDIIQIAYTMYDNNFNELKKINYLINEGIGKIDYYEKFTLEDIYTNGLNPHEALHELRDDMTFSTHLICHNINFDAKLIYKYFSKYNVVIDKKPIEICTMKLSKHICQCVDIRGRIKNAKLSELYLFFFGEAPDETKTHTADYDIAITARCFQHMLTNNLIDNKILNNST